MSTERDFYRSIIEQLGNHYKFSETDEKTQKGRGFMVGAFQEFPSVTEQADAVFEKVTAAPKWDPNGFLKLSDEEADLAKSLAVKLAGDERNFLRGAQWCKMWSSDSFRDVIEEFAFLRSKQLAGGFPTSELAESPEQRRERCRAANSAVANSMFEEAQTDPMLENPGDLIKARRGGAVMVCPACALLDGRRVEVGDTSDIGFGYREWPNFTQVLLPPGYGHLPPLFATLSRQVHYANIQPIMDLANMHVRCGVNCSRCNGHMGHCFREFPELVPADNPQKKADASVSGHSFCMNGHSLAFVNPDGSYQVVGPWLRDNGAKLLEQPGAAH